MWKQTNKQKQDAHDWQYDWNKNVQPTGTVLDKIQAELAETRRREDELKRSRLIDSETDSDDDDHIFVYRRQQLSRSQPDLTKVNILILQTSNLSINQIKLSSIKYPDKLKEAKLTLMNYINQPVGKLITFWICDKQSQRFFQRGQRRPLNTAQNQTRHPKKRWLHIFTGGQLVTTWPHNNSASHR